MTLKTQDLVQTKHWLSESQRNAISGIIEKSFSNVVPQAYLAKYFDCPAPFERKIRLYYQAEKLVGYCLLTFTDDKNLTIIRASAAFLPEHRQGGNTFSFSIQESVSSWLKRPWRRYFYADTMLSPAMYRAIAKKTGIIWPHFSLTAPKVLFEHFNHNGQISEANALRCLVSVDRKTNYTEQEVMELKASNKPEIQYYCKVNPDFNRGMALFVIIPINFWQLAKTLIKAKSARPS